MLVYCYPTSINNYFICNTYGACFLCIYILMILYYNVIVLLLFVFVTLIYLHFICIVCVFLLYYSFLLRAFTQIACGTTYCYQYYYLLLFAIVMYCYLICFDSLYIL